MILDEGLLLEIVRPGTGDPVPAGEVGEVVITTFNHDYPLIRFGTGDLSAVLPGAEPLRAHQHAHPRLDGPRRPDHQGARHVRDAEAGERDRAPPSGDPQGAAGGRGRNRQRPHDAALRGEGAPRGLAEAIVASIREVTKLRGEVELVDAGSLPNDGKVIEDLRKYV